MCGSMKSGGGTSEGGSRIAHDEITELLSTGGMRVVLFHAAEVNG